MDALCLGAFPLVALCLVALCLSALCLGVPPPDAPTLSRVLSLMKGFMTLKTASTYHGWFTKWIAPNRAGKQS